MHFLKNVFIGITAFAILVHANVQYDLKGFFLYNNYTSGDTISRYDTLWSIEHDVRARKDFSNGWAIYFNDAVDGSSAHFALPEKTIPFLHSMLLGSEYRKKGAIGIELAQELFGGAQQIKPEYVKKIVMDSVMIDPDNNTVDTITTVIDPVLRQKATYHGRLFFTLPANRWQFSGSVNYFRLQHSLEKIGDLFTPDSVLKKNVYENITYSTVDIQFAAMAALRFNAGMWLKNDFGNVPFDYGNFSVSINGDPAIKFTPQKKFYLAYDWAGLYRFGKAFNDKTNAGGFGTSLYVHPVLKLSRASFVKGTIILDMANKSFKQWYEATLRQVWGTRSSFVEACYFGSYGTLFPRHGIRMNGSFFFGKMGVHPEVEAIMRYSATGTLQAHRITPGLEISIRPFKWTEIYLGGDLYYFKDYRPFSDRGIAYLGIRGW